MSKSESLGSSGSTADNGPIPFAIRKLMQRGKGFVMLDESVDVLNGRLQNHGISPIANERRAFRNRLIRSSALGHRASGIILPRTMIRKSDTQGVPYLDTLEKQGVSGIMRVGVAEDISKSTRHLERVGAIAAKTEISAETQGYRAVLMTSGARNLAEIALASQSKDKASVISPQLSAYGSHTLRQSYDAHMYFYEAVTKELEKKELDPSGIIVISSAVSQGKYSNDQHDNETIGRLTASMLRNSLPPEIGGIALSFGDHGAIPGASILNAINKDSLAAKPVTFAYTPSYLDGVLPLLSEGKSDEADAYFADALHASAHAAIGSYTPNIDVRIETT